MSQPNQNASHPIHRAQPQPNKVDNLALKDLTVMRGSKKTF